MGLNYENPTVILKSKNINILKIMEKYIFSLVFMFVSFCAFSQTNDEIESQIIMNSLLLGSAQFDVVDMINSTDDFVFTNDEVINGLYYRVYYYKPMGSMVFYEFDNREWYEYSKVCTKVIQSFFYSTSHLETVQNYFAKRSVFKFISPNKYQLLATSNPYLNLLAEKGYKVTVLIQEKILDKNITQNNYQLICHINFEK